LSDILSEISLPCFIIGSEVIESVKTTEEPHSLEKQEEEGLSSSDTTFPLTVTAVEESKERRESVQEDTRFTESMTSMEVEAFGRPLSGLLFGTIGSGDQRPESLSSLLLELLDSLDELLELE
jgi:hypothetical protein